MPYSLSQNYLHLIQDNKIFNLKLMNIQKSEEPQYVIRIIPISEDIICVATYKNLKFYIRKTNQQLISSMDLAFQFNLQHQIRQELLCNYKYFKKTLIEQVNLLKQQFNQQFLNMEITSEKGITYCQKDNNIIFFLIVSTSTNKYLISFKILIQDINFKVHNIVIHYDFKYSSNDISHNLQINPQLVYLQKSQTLIIIRKFFNQSLVVVFKKNPQMQQYFVSWTFKIHQQCLSNLDDERYLINYRQNVSKKCIIDLQIVDILQSDIINVHIDRGVQPMNIRGIHKLTDLNQLNVDNINLQTKKSSESQSSNANKKTNVQLILRIYGVLQFQQSTYVLDYSVNKNATLATYVLQQIAFQQISVPHGANDASYYFVAFLYKQKIYQSILLLQTYGNKKHNSQKIKLEQIKSKAVCFQDNGLYGFQWNICRGLIIGYQTQLAFNSLNLNILKLINKAHNYLYLLHNYNSENQGKYNYHVEHKGKSEQLSDQPFRNIYFMLNIISLLQK